jgi:phosphoribosylformylglycinamidine cyclo-ligase
VTGDAPDRRRPGDAYARAGVSLHAAAEAVSRISGVASAATREEVRGGVGGFAGLFDIGGGRLLAAATDGVGTKLDVARAARRLDTVGIDLVAMCADDVVCAGAEPLFFLDYLAVGRVDPADVEAIVSGVAEGCRRAGCALLGGETAEHPGVMPPDAFDLAGTCVGVVAEAAVLDPGRVREGDVLVGVASSGLHANGYSLVRSAMLDSGAFLLGEVPEGLDRTLAEELLEPTAIYAPLVLELARAGVVTAAAHVTGGGLVENVPRALLPGARAEVRRGSWPEPAIFELVRRAANASDDDMFATFNMGIGMVVVAPPSHAAQVLERCAAAGHRGFDVGRVVGGPGPRLAVV